MEEFTMETERVLSGNIRKQKEAVCMTRSDSMSIGSVGSDVISIGGGSEEMDTEDSEKDPKECVVHRGRLTSQEMQQNLALPLDNRDNGYDLERIKGDVTSPVIENKLSDDVSGYYAMRTSLLSQSAVILENGAAVGKSSSGSYEDSNCNVGTAGSQVRSSGEVGKTWKAFHTGYSSGSESEEEEEAEEGWDRSMLSVDEKHDSVCFDSKQDSNVQCATEVEIKRESLSEDEEECRGDSLSRLRRKALEVKTEPLSDTGEYRDDSRVDMRTDDVTNTTKADNTIDRDATRRVPVEILDGHASDSMAEVEKFGLQAKLARVSKRRIYSRARELSQASDSSSESDSDDESDDDEEEKEMIFDDLHSAKVLVNAAQPDSEKLIEREVMKMACMDDLLSDCVSSDDSSEDSSDDSSSGESSDSDDSSDSDLSSADDSDDEAEEEERKPTKGRQNSAVSKEGFEKGLPEVEYLDITLPPHIDLTKVGHVSSIIGSLVIIQADPGSPALNVESVLFKSDRTALGKVYDLFGPVVSPFYSVRFNNAADIDQQGVKLKSEVFFAPKNVDVTQYVFTEQLKKQRGTDASWKNDEECPPENADFSDDEVESMVRNKKKNERKRKVPQVRNESFQQGRGQWRNNNRQDQYNSTRNQPRPHPPLQRQPACRPPQFGPPKHFQQHQHHQYQQRFQPRPSNQWMGPPRGEFPYGPQGEFPMPPGQWTGIPPRPPGGFQPGAPPMFQNPQATETSQGQPPVSRQQGFSALKMSGRIPARQKNVPAVPVSQGGLTGAVPSLVAVAPPPLMPQQALNVFANPPTQPPVPAPFPGFNLFSIPPPPLILPPPPPPAVSSAGDASNHTPTPPSLMTQPVLPPAATLGQMQWSHSQGQLTQTQSNPKPFNPPPPPPGVSPQRTGGHTQPPTPLMEEDVQMPASTGGQSKWPQGHATQTSSNPKLGVFSAPPPPPGVPPGDAKDHAPKQLQWNQYHSSKKQFNPKLGAMRPTAPVSISNFAPPPIPPPSFHPRMMQSFKQTSKTPKS